MIAKGRVLAEIADNVVMKIPLTMEGLKACAEFKRLGIKQMSRFASRKIKDCSQPKKQERPMYHHSLGGLTTLTWMAWNSFET